MTHVDTEMNDAWFQYAESMSPVDVRLCPECDNPIPVHQVHYLYSFDPNTALGKDIFGMDIDLYLNETEEKFCAWCVDVKVETKPRFFCKMYIPPEF